jgi:hypothetical protein
MSVDEINAALTSSRVPRRARRRLNGLLDTKQIDPTALQWLLSAVDPFCDEELTVVGFPSTRQTRSVPQMITRTYNVSIPPALSGNWDCAVVFMPVFVTGSDFQLYSTTMTSGILSARSGASIFSGVTIYAGDEGMDWRLDGTAITAHNDVALPDTYQQSEFRLTACGFEVVNTTAELYKQGSVTTGRVANGKCLMGVNRGSLGVPIYQSGEGLLAPPSNQEDLAIFPGSRTWGAKDGVYSICTLADPINPPVRNMPNPVFCFPDQGPPPASTPLAGWHGLPTSSAHVAGWDSNVAHFSGLSPETTLQVTVRYYLERFPPPDSELIVMAQRPTPFDPMALHLYALGLQHFNCAVPQGENPLGEWLNRVLDAVGFAAPIIGTAVGAFTAQPEIAVLGSAAGAAAKAVAARRRKQAADARKPQTRRVATPGNRRMLTLKNKQIKSKPG